MTNTQKWNSIICERLSMRTYDNNTASGSTSICAATAAVGWFQQI